LILLALVIERLYRLRHLHRRPRASPHFRNGVQWIMAFTGH